MINAYSPNVTAGTRTGATWIGDAGSSPNPAISFSINAPAYSPIVFWVERANPVGTSGLSSCDYSIISSELESVPLRTIDVDGDGQVGALTDGLLVLRYMFGLRGNNLTNGAVLAGGTRKTAAEIETWILSLFP